MKRLLFLFFLLILLMAACAPKTPADTGEPSATEPPAETAPPEEPPALTEAPINLAGPPMEVGSKFRYVDGSILVAVPAGEFIMGHDQEDNPEHTVFLDDFWIYRTPVTNRQYEYCVRVGQCALPDLSVNVTYGDPLRANDPVVGVNWEQAVSYCNYVQGRLPTESEWEKTARGPNGNPYPWGEAAPSCDNTNAANCVRTTTNVIDYFPQGQSYYEALDMAGNVWEWTGDWYNARYYSESPAENPLGPETGEKRSVRSSSFASAFFETELARRYSTYPVDRRSDLGFRCVVDAPTTFAPYCETMVVYGLDADGNPVPGGQGTVDCPTITVGTDSTCENGQGVFTITSVSSDTAEPPPLIINPGPCTGAGTGPYTCTSAGTFSACQACEVTPGGEPTCPPGYNQVGNQCIVDQGYPGECLPGYNYDPETQCCQAEPGQGDSFPLCDAGTSYAGANLCVDFPAQQDKCVDVGISLEGCEEHDSGGTTGVPIELSPLASAMEQEQPDTPVGPVSGVLTLTTLTLGLAGWIFTGRKRS